MNRLTTAKIIPIITWVFLTSCQDQIGQTENPTTTQQENNTASNNNPSSNQSTHNNQNSPNNKADNNKWNADPSDPEGRLVEGEWSDEDRFTIVPPALQSHQDENLQTQFCDISKFSNSILIIEVLENIQTYYECPYDMPVSEYKHSYTKIKVKRMLHLGGVRLPLEFEFNNLKKEVHLPEGKTYILGIAEIDGKFFSYRNLQEIHLYDPEKESTRIEFSGKKEALISNAEAHMKDRESLCPNIGSYSTKEEFKEKFLDRKEGQCDYLNP